MKPRLYREQGKTNFLEQQFNIAEIKEIMQILGRVREKMAKNNGIRIFLNEFIRFFEKNRKSQLRRRKGFGLIFPMTSKIILFL